VIAVSFRELQIEPLAYGHPAGGHQQLTLPPHVQVALRQLHFDAGGQPGLLLHLPAHIFGECTAIDVQGVTGDEDIPTNGGSPLWFVAHDVLRRAHVAHKIAAGREHGGEILGCLPRSASLAGVGLATLHLELCASLRREHAAAARPKGHVQRLRGHVGLALHEEPGLFNFTTGVDGRGLWAECLL